MWDGAGLGMRGGMYALQSRLGSHIYSPLAQYQPAFKQGLNFTGRSGQPSVRPFELDGPSLSQSLTNLITLPCSDVL